MKKAFTLAEVLITLGIIGVVAALTLPSVITKHQEKVLAVSIRKLYSDINNGFRLSQVENEGNIDYSTVFNPNNTSNETAKEFAKYFDGAIVCENPNQPNCINVYHHLKYSDKRTDENGNSMKQPLAFPLVVLKHGAMLSISQSNHPNCRLDETIQDWDSEGNLKFDQNGEPIMVNRTILYCGFIYFDVNGTKGPNQFGRDASRLVVYKNKILPEAQPYEGGATLRNILSGKDEFVYEKY